MSSLFFLKITLVLLNCLHFHINLQINLLISTKKGSKILIEIGLILQVNLKKINMLTMLTLPIHEHSKYLYLGLLYFLSTICCSFQCIQPCLSFVKLLVLLHFGTIINGIFFNFPIVFLCYIKIQKFYILTLYPATLQN